MKPTMCALRSTVLISLCVIAGCSKNPAIVSTDYLEGNCVGTVKDAAGSPAPGASLVLVPEGYSPLATTAGNGRVDSTVSDEYGRYAFTVNAPGAYNLLAKSKGLYAMRRPIRISADARVILDDEILMAPGSLSGVVHLQKATDHRPAVILFLGTTLYAKPSDSTGAFSVAALAQGSYTLRILTADNNYAAVETTITVTSGARTTLPCIELEKKFVPIVDSLSVIYDPLMMLAHLAWPAIDTSKIKSYAVYCNRSKNLIPVTTVGNGVTACTLDIISSPSDTFQYQICAIDKEGIEGPPAMGKLFVKYSAIAESKLTCAISLANPPPFDFEVSGLCFDRRKNIFVTFGNKIIKLDSLGTVQGEFLASRSSDTSATRSSFDHFDVYQTRIDTAGNIFAMVYSSCASVFSCSFVSIIKISNDLKFSQEISTDSVTSSQRFSIAVSAAGALILYVSRGSDDIADGTHIRVYDPQFNLVKADSVPDILFINRSTTCNDTTIGFLDDHTQYKFRIVYFDAALSVIASPVNIDYAFDFKELSSFVPPQSYPPSSPIFLGLKDLFAVGFYAGTATPSGLFFINDHMQPVARLPMPDDEPMSIDVYFDEKGNLYRLSSTENNTILKYSMEKVLKR